MHGYVCLYDMHVRSTVSKCSVCGNTGGLCTDVAALPMHLFTLKKSPLQMKKTEKKKKL